MSDSIRLAQKGDAEDIVGLFLNEYDRYFGKFSDPDKMAESIEHMHRGLQTGDPWAGVMVLDAPDDLEWSQNGIEGVSAVKQNRPGWSELSSTVIDPEARSQEVDGVPVYQLLHQARESFDEEVYPDEKRYTQTVSFTGKSQKGSMEAGFVPVGYSDGQFFEAHNGEGRISTVYMIDSGNDYTGDGEVYTPDNEAQAVEQVLENLDEAGVDIERTLENDEERPEEVAVKEQNAETIGQARLTVIPDKQDGYDTWSYDRVLDWVDQMQSREDIDWTGLEIDAGNPVAASIKSDTGLDFERYQPDGIRTEDGWRDIIGLQGRPSGTRERYFVDDAMSVIEAAGIPHERYGSREYSGTEVHRAEIS
ncbi:hypothetical protein ACK3SF_02690 [Candidatus Nanosalina sp. VS9-1]|uniref:hypothetical protein n=1 Tax=Candidatus Nanosalina sp. VS9-1 TaxID=3388566 RepID=UPI0039E191D8